MEQKAKGGIDDLEEFLGSNISGGYKINYSQPLEIQGFMDSMEVMQFIIHLESKHSTRLSREEIKSIKTYQDLLNILAKK